MSGEQLLNANKTLDEPPIIGLDLSRSLGFTVVSRLAHRRGIGVRITGGTDGGVSAVVTVPAEMVGNPTETEAPPAPVVDEPPMPAVIPAPSPPPVSVFEAPVEAQATFDTLQVTPVPSGVSELATLPRRKPQFQTATAAPPVNAPAVRLPAPDAPISPEPVEQRIVGDVGAGDHAVTKAGLVRRTPKQVNVADASQYVPGPREHPQTPTPVNRSPEEVRRRLTQYRAGLHRGRSPESLDDNSNRPS